MTSIKAPSPTTIRTTQSVSSSAPTTASTASAATGSGVQGSQQTSSFSAAASSGSPGGKLQQVLNDAKDALKDVSGSAKDDFMAYLNKGYASSADMKKGLEAFEKMAQNGDINQEQYDKLKKAIGFRMAGRTVISQMLQAMEQIMQDINKPRG